MTKPMELTLKRVKIYKLYGSWLDQGTGFCTGEISNDKARLVVVDESNREKLLEYEIEGQIQFQRQQESLIVWTDSFNGDQWALSFQEKEGCGNICDFLIKCFRSRVCPLISLTSVISTPKGDEINEIIFEPLDFYYLSPKDDFNELTKVWKFLIKNSNAQHQRESIAEYLSRSPSIILNLLEIFHNNEKNHNIQKLHVLCNILKTLILYNEGSIIELLLDDNNINGLIGILEYNPEYPTVKSNFRDFLNDYTNFKEIVPIKDDYIKSLIKRNFILQFLKDVVLVRLLDDPTLNLLSTLIHFNEVEIIEFLERSNLIDELFQIYDTNDDNSNLVQKRDGVKLVHQFILTSKNLPYHQKSSFYSSLIRKGLKKLITFVLNDDEVESKILGAEVIVAIVEHDVLIVNGTIDDGRSIKQVNNTEEESDDDDDDDYEDNDDGNDKVQPHTSDGKDNDKQVDSNQNDDEHEQSKYTPNSFFKGDEYEREGFYEDGQEDEEDYDYIERPNIKNPKSIKLLDDMTLHLALTQFLVEGKNPGLSIQAFEALKSLLDPLNTFQTGDGSLNSLEYQGDEGGSIDQQFGQHEQQKNSLINNSNYDSYFEVFSLKVAPILFKSLIENEDDDGDNDDLNLKLVELINFISNKKNLRSFILENHLLLGISKLIKPNHKLQLRLSAIRCLKTFVQLNDDYYTRYIITNDLFNQIFKTLENAQALSYSTILNFLEKISIGFGFKKFNNFKLLQNYLVDNYKDQLIRYNKEFSYDYFKNYTDTSDERDELEKINKDNDTHDNDDNDDNSDDENDNEIPTEPLEGEDDDDKDTEVDSKIEKEILPDVKKPTKNQISIKNNENINYKKEKRLREEDFENLKEKKKKSSLKEKFSNASKKIASKFSK